MMMLLSTTVYDHDHDHNPDYKMDRLLCIMLARIRIDSGIIMIVNEENLILILPFPNLVG